MRKIVSRSLWKRTLQLPPDLLHALLKDVETHWEGVLKVLERETRPLR